MLFIKLL